MKTMSKKSPDTKKMKKMKTKVKKTVLVPCHMCDGTGFRRYDYFRVGGRASRCAECDGRGAVGKVVECDE